MGEKLDKAYSLGERAVLIIDGKKYKNIGTDGLIVIIGNWLDMKKKSKPESALKRIREKVIKNIPIPKEIKDNFDVSINKKNNKVIIKKKR